MAEVRIAHIAGHLDSVRAAARIQMIGHHSRRDRLCETRPPRMALVLGRSIKELCAATKALVPARFKQLAELRAVGPFGPLQTGDPKLLVGQQFTPLGLGLLDTAGRGWIAVFGQVRHLTPCEGGNRWHIMCFVIFLSFHEYSLGRTESYTLRYFLLPVDIRAHRSMCPFSYGPGRSGHNSLAQLLG